ncbi:MAG: hypothetical protein L0Z49_11465 [Actinobacteria bacterium]|nr:hypothetical protein [Actinomycetota bacterium]MCI0545044.1 hypothetical protein [Actinomycetota bacterium]
MDGLLLTVHILSASVWVGAGIYSSVTYPRHAANGTLRGVVAVDQKLGSIVFGTAIALLLLSGVGLVLMSDTFGFGHAFVLVGIGVVVVSSILEGAVFGPANKRVMEGGDPVVLPRVFRWALPVYVVIFGFTIWAMVTKLGA